MPTNSQLSEHSRGFVLIEALVALIVVALGLLGIARLQALTLTSSADTKTRAQAIALVESELETRRNQLLRTGFNNALAVGTINDTRTVAGANAQFTLVTTISAVGTSNARVVDVTVSWTDILAGRIPVEATPVSGRTIVSWDDPALGRSLQTGGVGGGLPSNFSLRAPTGAAIRGDRTTQDCSNGQCSTAPDGLAKIRVANNVTQLLDASNRLIIYLPAKADGTARQFTTIRGRVYIDANASGQMPSPSNLSVRLSSEGECLFNNADNATIQVCTGGTCNNSSLMYEYFSYTCYVGEGWFGNVGIWNSSNQTPKICVGDPSFNNGGSNGTLISPHATESNIRSYRGFKQLTSGYAATGVQNNTHYGYVLTGNTGTDALYPVATGAPKPSIYKPGSYGSVTTNSDDDRFTHHFLVTRNNQSCLARTNLRPPDFSRNAGKYFCISPDDDPAADACPSTWPGFEGQTGGSGSTFYRLSVTASAGGTVTSNPAGIDCSATNTALCGYDFANNTAVTLNATPSTGYLFNGWGGACSGPGSCSVTLSQNQAVTANFVLGQAGQSQLQVTVAGNGGVTSSPTGINCGSNSTCSAGFNTGTSVTLTAEATTGNTFTGWSGSGCSGTGSCSVTMDAAKSVTANFSSGSPTTLALTVSKQGNGTGTVTSSPSGINCGSTCTGNFSVGATVTLSAAAATGSTFGGWSGACSGTGSCSVTLSQARNVTATFHPNTCITTISGSAKDGNGKFVITPQTTPTASSCAHDSGNNLNYSCSLRHAGGTAVSIREESANGSTVYSTLNFVTNCGTNSNINFP